MWHWMQRMFKLIVIWNMLHSLKIFTIKTIVNKNQFSINSMFITLKIFCTDNCKYFHAQPTIKFLIIKNVIGQWLFSFEPTYNSKIILVQSIYGLVLANNLNLLKLTGIGYGYLIYLKLSFPKKISFRKL